METEFKKIINELCNQYCKEWECRKMGLIKYNGYCEEHCKDIQEKDREMK